jgi:predicted  nucleic acid-binding Zn-ribbon protein
MSKLCLKCGFENPENPTDSLAECPKCGAIYSRVEEALDRASSDKSEREAREAKLAAQRLLAEERRREQMADFRAKAQANAEALRSKMASLSGLRAFFAFRYLVTLQIAKVVFAGLVGLSLLTLAVVAFYAPAKMLAGQIILVTIGLMLFRIFLEFVVIMFRIAATLEEVNEKLVDQRVDKR